MASKLSKQELAYQLIESAEWNELLAPLIAEEIGRTTEVSLWSPTMEELTRSQGYVSALDFITNRLTDMADQHREKLDE